MVGGKTGYKIYSGEGGDKNAYIYKHLILGEFKKAIPNIGVVYREILYRPKKVGRCNALTRETD